MVGRVVSFRMVLGGLAGMKKGYPVIGSWTGSIDWAERAVSTRLCPYLSGLGRKWQGVIAHHSLTEDGRVADTDAITKYHTSWRYNDSPITEQKARALRAAGKKVIAPWSDVGYHFLIEYVGDVLVLYFGRPLTNDGAHCEGKNKTHIGICNVGNFDKAVPDDWRYTLTAILVRCLQKEFKIADDSKIEPHSRYAPKTCPGKKFDMQAMLRKVPQKII